MGTLTPATQAATTKVRTLKAGPDGWPDSEMWKRYVLDGLSIDLHIGVYMCRRDCWSFKLLERGTKTEREHWNVCYVHLYYALD